MKSFISSDFWSDPCVEELDAEGKLAVLWLLTNSKRDLCGFTEISHRRFCFDTGLTVEALQRALKGLGKGFVVPQKGFIWSRNFVAHQLGRGPKLTRNNITKSVVRHLVTLPESFQELFLEEYPELEPLTKGLPSPYEGERKGKGKVKVKDKAKREPKPELDEVVSHMTEKLADLNSEWTPDRVRKATMLKYETCIDNGWKDGHGQPIKNWKLKFLNMLKFEKPWAYGAEIKTEEKRKAAQLSSPL